MTIYDLHFNMENKCVSIIIYRRIVYGGVFLNLFILWTRDGYSAEENGEDEMKGREEDYEDNHLRRLGKVIFHRVLTVSVRLRSTLYSICCLCICDSRFTCSVFLRSVVKRIKF
ncbi:hypothetical protein VNO80_02670 [Phaseolus coccineus]|uniref:Uncharacterized protein n=1 Tax=Phaseolus coccineus TaxID=3886 RepID=A0AAN9NUN3_PHACN